MNFFKKIVGADTSSSSSCTDEESSRREDLAKSISGQINSLNDKERESFENIKQQWHLAYPGEPFDDQMVLLFARMGKFDETSALKMMENYDRHYLTLTAKTLKRQLRTRTLFPLPGLETKEGNEVFYMRPSRYTPTVTPVETIIDNLVYVMGVMCEKEKNLKNGIAFMANMKSWTMKNYSMEYCYNFMMALQGSTTGCKVTHFFIVDPPSWFGKVWAMMKGVLAPSFRRRVKMVKEDDLGKYLMSGYKEFLPTEMKTGKNPTQEIVEDFIDERKEVEATRKARHVQYTKETSETDTTETENTHCGSADFSSKDLTETDAYGSEEMSLNFSEHNRHRIYL